METVSYANHLDEAKSHVMKSKPNNWFILDAHEKKYLRHGDSSEHHHSSKQKSSVTSAPMVAYTDSAAVYTTSDEDHPKHKNIKLKMKRDKSSKLESDVHDELDEVKQEEEQQNHKPQKWKATEKDLFFSALEKYGKLFQSLH